MPNNGSSSLFVGHRVQGLEVGVSGVGWSLVFKLGF